MAADTVIAEQTRIDGSLSGDTDVTLQGVIDGQLQLAARLDIDEPGLFTGELRADVVDIAGAVEGTIAADELVILRESARVRADISAPAIQVEPGAQVSGDIDVEGEASSSASSTTRAASTASTSTSSSSRTSTRRSRTSNRSNAAASSSTSSSSSAGSSTSESAAQPAAETAEESTATETKDKQSQADETEESSEQEDEKSYEEKSISELDRTEISEEYTVRELRDELRSRDMKVGGTKSELINRLLSSAD